MEVYKCLSDPCGQEWFSNSPPLKKDKLDKGILGVACELVTCSTGIDESKIGANASAEEESEQLEDSEKKELSCKNYGVDKFEEYLTIFPNKKALGKYMRSHLKKVLEQMKERDPKRYEELRADDAKIMKEVLANFLELYESPSDVDIFARIDFDYERFDPIFIGVYDESGENVTLYTLNDSFFPEKV